MSTLLRCIRQSHVLALSHSNPFLTSNRGLDDKRLGFPQTLIRTPFCTKETESTFKVYQRLIRMDKPIGSYLLFWPCAWSVGMATASGHFPSVALLSLFGLGSFVMRGAGCIINDLWDRDIDKKVDRTRTRPLAAGSLSPQQAIGFLTIHLATGLAILLSLNTYSILLGFASMPLVILYPYMKRITFWPQAFLGLTFNWGALIGWAAVQGHCDWTVCLPLYFASVSWTLIYDTIYGFQDIKDDVHVGVKSTSILFGHDKAKLWLAGFSSTMISFLLVSGFNACQSWPYFLSVTGCAAHLYWQIQTVDLRSPADCLSKFKSNNIFGALLFLGILLGNLVQAQEK